MKNAVSNGFEIEVLRNGAWTNFCSALTPREAAEQREWAARDLKCEARIWSNKLGREMSF